MRDLHAARAERAPTELHLDLEEEPGTAEPAQARLPFPEVDRQIRAARREQKVAGLTVMLLDAAKMVEPVVELLCDRALRWAALASFLGLTAYALREPTWERAAIAAGFAVLAPWVTRAWRS